MKRKIIIFLFIVVITSIVTIKAYSAKDKIISIFNEGSTYYFLQEGIYTSKDILEENTKDINVKAIDYKNNKYYVYLGITKDEKIAMKMKKIYENQGYQIYIRELKLANEEFDSNLIQFDFLANSVTTDKELLTIQEVVLANYEEIIKNR